MAKRSRKKKPIQHEIAPSAPKSKGGLLWLVWPPLLLTVVAFFVYWPSLKSDFVYDARWEIIEEGFIPSISNLPAVLSLQVLKMNLMLGPRPGQLLYLMLNAAAWGKEPFGYHLASNLLHAANVALLFVLLRRLIATETAGLAKNGILKVQLALAAVTLLFALHPIVVEPVAEISFSSDLLVTFFTLTALLAATAFRPERQESALIIGGAGALCAFASVTCKESGLATAFLLVAYWFLFRRREAKLPWVLFLSAAMLLTAAFLAARFLLAPPAMQKLDYLGGSFSQVFLIQPRLWVFMMGKLVWPVGFAGDYTLANVSALSAPLAIAILAVVVALQIWLAWKSRIGALGVLVYWSGLATVSNFMPLYRILADRFYYLPMAGIAMQLFALLLMTLKSQRGFWIATTPCLVALVPLTFLTMIRENVFVDDFAFWSDTLQVSPLSSQAHSGFGNVLLKRGLVDEAMAQFQKAVEIDPNFAEAHNNLGTALYQKDRIDESIAEYQKTLTIRPTYADALNNLGLALSKKGKMDEAIVQFQKALEIDPNHAEAHDNLGLAFLDEKRMDEAIAQFQRTLEIDPNHVKAHNNLGYAFMQKGQWDEAITQLQKAAEIDPGVAQVHSNLGFALFQKGRLEEAKVEFQKILQLNPDDEGAKGNLQKIEFAIQQKAGGK